MPAAHQNLRRPVVLRHHLLGHVARRVGLLHPGQPEVTNLTDGDSSGSVSADSDVHNDQNVSLSDIWTSGSDPNVRHHIMFQSRAQKTSC